jgi:hypothetical protein
MPVLDTVAPARGNGQVPKGTNKVQIPNGTRPATIVDHYIFNVTNDKDRAYTTDVTGERNVRVKVQLDKRKVQLDKRPDIILAKTFRLYLGKKAAYAQFLQGITGIEAGSDAMRAFNTDELLTDRYKLVIVQTEYKDPYTNVLTIMPRPIEDDDLEQVPEHTPREPEPAPINNERTRARLIELLRMPQILPSEKDWAIREVTGTADRKSLTTPDIRARVVTILERKLKEIEEEIPL